MKTIQIQINELEIKDFQLEKIEGTLAGKIVLEKLLPVLQINAKNLNAFLQIGDALCIVCECQAFWKINGKTEPGLAMGDTCPETIKSIVTKFLGLELKEMEAVEAFKVFVESCPLEDDLTLRLWKD